MKLESQPQLPTEIQKLANGTKPNEPLENWITKIEQGSASEDEIARWLASIEPQDER